MAFPLVRKKFFWLIFTAIILALIMALLSCPRIAQTPTQTVKNYFPTPQGKNILVQIGDTIIQAELATSTEALARGLSGRTFLAPDQGMLFVFNSPSRHRFWMPEMNFPLDIIWIKDGQIADITRQATNDFDPSAPVFYQPRTPVRFVLEVNSGFAHKHNLRIGERVIFINPD